MFGSHPLAGFDNQHQNMSDVIALVKDQACGDDEMHDTCTYVHTHILRTCTL